nr:MAG TPA: hypothetical protein [Caudoviricetes sp.]
MHTALSNNKVKPDLLVRSGYFFALFTILVNYTLLI